MKGINLKKVGAVVAGLALASSVAFAGLWFKNVELVDDNGQPLAHIVVGQNAAASDSVVAANIAARIAKEAYAEQTLTAVVPNDVTCQTEATGEETGTCPISNERVTLKVTVPGTTVEGVHEFAAAIGDYIDRSLKDRAKDKDDDQYRYTTSELNENANPFTDGVHGQSIGGLPNQQALYKIGSDFSPFATSTITDPDTGDSYTESQAFYIYGQTKPDDDEVVTSLDLLTYQAKFSDNDDMGIPVCTKATDDDWAACAMTDDEYTGNHKVPIDFLGSKWIITEMEPANGDVTNENEVVEGGKIKLAKESVSGVISVGEELTSSDGQLKVRLDDIALQTGQENEHPAIVTLLDANDNALKQDQINPGETVEETVNGKTYKIRVYETAPGYTFGAKWADMALLEDEWELTSGDSLDDPNDDWTVYLLWKNKDAATDGDNTGGDKEQPDHLRSILLVRDTFDDDLQAGDSINVVEDPVAYKLTYKGLSLTNDDYDQLRFQKDDGANIKLADDTTVQLGEYIKITSQDNNAFEGSGGQGDTLYYVGLAPKGDYTTKFVDVKGNDGDKGVLYLGSNKADGFVKAANGAWYLVHGGIVKQLDGSVLPTDIDIILSDDGTNRYCVDAKNDETNSSAYAPGEIYVVNSGGSCNLDIGDSASPITSGNTISVVFTDAKLRDDSDLRDGYIQDVDGNWYKVVDGVVKNSDGTDLSADVKIGTISAGTKAVCIDANAGTNGLSYVNDAGTDCNLDIGVSANARALDPSSESVEDVFIDPNDDTTYDGTPDSADDFTNLGSPVAVYLIKETPNSNKYYVSAPFSADSAVKDRSVKYEDAGSSRSADDGGIIAFAPDTNPLFSLVEDAGDFDDGGATSDSHTADSLSFKYDTTNDNFEDANNGDDNEITYSDEHDIPNYGAIGTNGVDFEEGKFISPRGTLFESMDSDTVIFKVAKEPAEVQYEFATSEAAETGGSTQTLILHEGETGQVGDVSVEVQNIDEDVGACTVSAGGTATCTVPASDVQAVIMPQNSPTVQAITPYQGDVSGMVVLDSEAGALSSGVIISVGGPAVNTVSKDILAGTGIDLASTPVVVEAVGDNKIIVAGYSAQDTVQAGQQFLSQLQRQ